MKTYRIVCKQCKVQEPVQIDENNRIIWAEPKNIISGRYRLDMQWGWQCLACGNNDLVTKQEKREIKDLSSPDAGDITRVLRAIEPQAPQFVMEVM